ncbi:MAG: hypothetical protein ABUS56_12055, partial [Acidobacteriota bacterium]
MQRRFLSAAQEDELRQHLTPMFVSAERASAIESASDRMFVAIDAIDRMCEYAKALIAVKASSPGALGKSRAKQYAHSVALLAPAARLRELLTIERPLYRSEQVDWPTFEKTLAVLVDSLELQRDLTSPRGRGRPAQEWRDDLIK